VEKLPDTPIAYGLSGEQVPGRHRGREQRAGRVGQPDQFLPGAGAHCPPARQDDGPPRRPGLLECPDDQVAVRVTERRRRCGSRQGGSGLARLRVHHLFRDAHHHQLAAARGQLIARLRVRRRGGGRGIVMAGPEHAKQPVLVDELTHQLGRVAGAAGGLADDHEHPRVRLDRREQRVDAVGEADRAADQHDADVPAGPRVTVRRPDGDLLVPGVTDLHAPQVEFGYQVDDVVGRVRESVAHTEAHKAFSDRLMTLHISGA
jgi:hypothetical protein